MPAQQTKQDSYNPMFNQTLPSPSKRGALVEDLFGTKSSDGPMKTASGQIDDGPEFKLNDKYLNMSQQSNKVTLLHNKRFRKQIRWPYFDICYFFV